MRQIQLKRLKSLCFLLAFGSQICLQQTFFSYTGNDRNKQLLAAQQLLEGHGLSLFYANKDDLSKRVYEPLVDWPPGYSLGVIPTYWLTQDWMLSARIIASLGLCLIFLSIHLLWKLLLPNAHKAYIAFFLFWVISFTPFHYTSTSDELALGFFLLGIWGLVRGLTLYTLRNSNVAQYLFIIASFVLLALSASIRYAYLPLMWIFPALLLYRCWQKSPINQWAIWLGLIICIITSFVLLGAKSPGTAGGEAIFQLPEKLYIENWQYWDAFPLKAFAYMSISGLLNKIALASIWEIGLKIAFFIASISILLIGCYLILPFVRIFFQKKYRNLEPKTWGAVIVGSIGMMMLLMLGLLSLFQPPEMHDKVNIWTYVMETRYYAFLLIVIQMFVWWGVCEGKMKINKWVYIGLIVGAIGGSFYSLAHSSFRYYQRYVIGSPKETVYDVPSQRMKWIQSHIETKISEGKVCLFVYGDFIQDQDEASIAGLAGANIISFEALDRAFNTSKDLYVLTNVDDEMWRQNLVLKSLGELNLICVYRDEAGECIWRMNPMIK